MKHSSFVQPAPALQSFFSCLLNAVSSFFTFLLLLTAFVVLQAPVAAASSPAIGIMIDDQWQQKPGAEWLADSTTSMSAIAGYLKGKQPGVEVRVLPEQFGLQDRKEHFIRLAQKGNFDLLVLGSTRSSLVQAAAARSTNPWAMTYDDVAMGTERYSFTVNADWQIIDPASGEVIGVVSRRFLPGTAAGGRAAHDLEAARDWARKQLFSRATPVLYDTVQTWWQEHGSRHRQQKQVVSSASSQPADRQQQAVSPAGKSTGKPDTGSTVEPVQDEGQRGLQVNAVGSLPMAPGMKPELWGLAIGVSKYQKKGMDLKYADRDAQALAAFFNATASDKLFARVHFKTLLNKEVTRISVIENISRFLGQAAANDLVIIFLAGHGIKHHQSGSYYFVPYDADLENILSKGLRMSDFEESVRILNQNVDKVVVLMDTCHAGAMQVGARAVEGGENLAETLRESNGLFILSASQSGEPSIEDSRFALDGTEGHGVFTYSLLNALQGQANYDQNDYISIYEIFNYVNRKVPSLSNALQHPYSRVSGTDLPLVEVDLRKTKEN